MTMNWSWKIRESNLDEHEIINHTAVRPSRGIRNDIKKLRNRSAALLQPIKPPGINLCKLVELFFMWKRRSPGSHFSSSSQARVLPPSCLYSTSFPLLLFLFIRMWLTRWLLVAQIHSLLPICINEIVQIVPLQRIGPIVHCTTLCSLPCASEVTLQRRSSSVPAYRLEMASACFIRPEAWQSRMCPDEVWLVIWAFVAGTTSGHHIVSLAMSTYIRIYRC